MIEGRFAIKFITPFGEGGGFVILENDKVSGGDNDYIYDGTYYEKDGKMHARITLTNYTNRETAIFGKTKYCWMKAIYNEDAKKIGFEGECTIVDIDIPGVTGATVKIIGRRLN